MSKIKDTIEEEKEFTNKELETSEPKGYEFNNERHLHTFNGKALTGCTTILSILAKPALIQWAANMACDYMQEHWQVDIKDWELCLKEARTAHRKKKEEAGQQGTDIHTLIEDEIKYAIQNTNGYFLEKWKERYASPQVLHFIDWAIKNNVKFIESEKHIYSKEYWLGGIVDIVCEIDGEVWIADIKTGSGIYPEHFAQMAGYEIMLKEIGFNRKVKGHIVLNLKKDGNFEEKRSVSTEDAKNFFLACVQVYRLQEKFNNQII